MKLPQSFIRLPLRVDAERLAAEVEALPDNAWQAHPTGFAGNTAVPLISVNGGINDLISGPMQPTPFLDRCEYLRQVLAAFGVVFGRSRLMCLAGGAEVPRHCDVNYHWFTRVRIHIPVITYPEVEFHCADEMVNMAAGQTWIFDNWKMHRVVNPTPYKRIHLVADTVGSAGFWRMVEQVLQAGTSGKQPADRQIDYRPGDTVSLLTERYNTPPVMPPKELEVLCTDLIEDLGAARPDESGFSERFIQLTHDLMRDWQMLWTLYGPDPDQRGHYERLRNRVLRQIRRIPVPLRLPSNGRPAQNVLLARVLMACVDRPIPGVRGL